MNENLKPIPNYYGYYADDSGRIYSYRSGTQRLLSQRIHKGYYRVNLKNNKSKSGFSTEPVHKLVLETFVGIRPNGMVCRHLNGNSLDNRLLNLCWGTPQENTQDSIRHGTAACLRLGERAVASKLLLSDINEIKRLYQLGYLQCELAVQFGVTQRHISDIVRNKTWCHSYPMGDVKSSQLFKLDSGVGLRVEKRIFKRGYSPRPKRRCDDWQKTVPIVAALVSARAQKRSH